MAVASVVEYTESGKRRLTQGQDVAAEDARKACPRCQRVKAFSDFHRKYADDPSSTQTYCRKCHGEMKREKGMVRPPLLVLFPTPPPWRLFTLTTQVLLPPGSVPLEDAAACVLASVQQMGLQTGPANRVSICLVRWHRPKQDISSPPRPFPGPVDPPGDQRAVDAAMPAVLILYSFQTYSWRSTIAPGAPDSCLA